MLVLTIYISLLLFACKSSSSLNLLTNPKRAVWQFVSERARAGIVDRAKRIGVDFQANVEVLQTSLDCLENEYSQFINGAEAPQEFPDYYLKEFHAYEEGNLSWKAAMEVESAALAVHAPIFTESNQILRRDGDATLRNNYHLCMLEAFQARGGVKFRPTRVVDVGCSTGLSTLKLACTFPEARITGIDLSPYMLAVANFERRNKEGGDRIDYVFGAGERLAPHLSKDELVDLVSMCLVCHELPEATARDIYAEAFNVLESGGALSIMDIDPWSEFFLKFRRNRIAYAGFKSTEPWLDQYCEMDMVSRMEEVGFVDVSVRSNSKRHRTVVGWKP